MQLVPTEFSPDDSTIQRPENKPFICRPEKSEGETAALLIHGFTATPWEMAPLARHLASKGITSVAIRLPGHGTTPEDLSRRRYEEWIETTDNGHQFLKKEKKHVVAVGLSTGAMVALAAHTSNNFDGLALLSPYLKIRHPFAPLAGLLRYIVRYQHREITTAEQPYYYAKRPVAGIHQINRLVRRVKEQLPVITAPTLVACAEDDQTVDPQSAIELYKRLGSQNKQLHSFGKGVPHVMTTTENPSQQEILELVSHFIENI